MNIYLDIPRVSDLESLEEIYIISFPPEERRPWAQIMMPVAVEGPRLRAVYDSDSGECAGFITYWLFDTFVYVEHFAVNPAIRGGGVGSCALKAFIGSMGRPVVLEVEPADAVDPMAPRRIEFYRRHGFEILDYDYIQPPYAPGLPSVPLKLMSTDSSVDAGVVASVLHSKVYGQL